MRSIKIWSDIIFLFLFLSSLNYNISFLLDVVSDVDFVVVNVDVGVCPLFVISDVVSFVVVVDGVGVEVVKLVGMLFYFVLKSVWVIVKVKLMLVAVVV